MNINPGQSHTSTTIVTDRMTAHAVADRAGEEFPAVLSTPALVTEMERAAAVLLQPLLSPEEVSVGVNVEIRHIHPTPVGAELRTHARYTGRDRRLYWFDVWSEDPGGIVSEGRHARAIVRLDAIEAKADARLPANTFPNQEP